MHGSTFKGQCNDALTLQVPSDSAAYLAVFSHTPFSGVIFFLCERAAAAAASCPLLLLSDLQ